MSWASELPQELLCRPTGLVVLTGLDLVYNALHKVVWDSFFNNRRPDRVPMQFKVLRADHEYPKCRSKRSSYEWYIPKGTLKTSWMKKHLDQVPAVLVVFFDLDWDEAAWKEKQMECSTKVEIVRNSLISRGTKVCVVLIQKNAPLPPGEDVVAAERAASLCTACELSAKSLFVLPLTDHLQGYVIRLENAFYELAQNYYHTEARKVKAHKEFLNKTTHQLLFVRHQFKIAFFNELKQDTHAALKHYKQAYSHILELRMHDTNLLEVKTIAGFVNYKICRLSFQHNAPLDAISQFRKHIDFFKKKIGISELAFEHSAWMSKQFQVFGDLFDEAIKLGLTAVQTQHPGFYYQQSANHAVSRKQLCRGMSQSSSSVPSPDTLENLGILDYYGQRPWRQGHQSIDPPDALRERDGILALQQLELQVDHSWTIIPLFSSAVSQFKKYKSPRMKRFLMVQMGEEYCHAMEYTKALTLLTRVMWDYRQERWWELLTSILSTALRCSYLVGNLQEYVTISMELMGNYTLFSPEEKTRVQMNLIRVMSNETPDPEPGCSATSVEHAKQLWKYDKSSEPFIFTVEMHNLAPFVECKACFSEDLYTADSKISLTVSLRMSCPFPIRFSKLSVLLSNQVYNQHCVITDEGPTHGQDSTHSDLYVVPEKTHSFSFSFYAQQEDIGKTLEITSIALELGQEGSRCAILHWSGGGGDAVAPPLSQQVHFKHRPGSSSDGSRSWEDIRVKNSTKLKPRPAMMSVNISHDPPALVSEYYIIKVTVINEENRGIENVQLALGLKEGEDSNIELSTHVSLDVAEFDGKVISRKGGIELGSLALEQSAERVFYVKCLETGDRELHVKVTYDVTMERDSHTLTCTCHKEESLTLSVIEPFSVQAKVMSMQYCPIDVVHAEEAFLMLAEIECRSPWTVDIQTSRLQLSSYMKQEDNNPESQVEGVSLQSGDGAGECWCLVAPQSAQPTVPTGKYVLQWKRHSSDAAQEPVPTVETSVTLPSITVEHIPIFVELDIPAHGNVRQIMPATYNIYNRTAYSQEIEVTMEPSDAFMFSGHKQVHFRILPHNKHEISYNFVPLLPGNLVLPRLHLNMTRYPGTMDELVWKMLPTDVFVMPTGRQEQSEQSSSPQHGPAIKSE